MIGEMHFVVSTGRQLLLVRQVEAFRCGDKEL
jgi:hypothetical protein